MNMDLSWFGRFDGDAGMTMFKKLDLGLSPKLFWQTQMTKMLVVQTHPCNEDLSHEHGTKSWKIALPYLNSCVAFGQFV